MEHSNLVGEYIPFSESKSIVELVVKETPPSSVSASWAPIAAAAADCSSNSWCWSSCCSKHFWKRSRASSRNGSGSVVLDASWRASTKLVSACAVLLRKLAHVTLWRLENILAMKAWLPHVETSMEWDCKKVLLQGEKRSLVEIKLFASTIEIESAQKGRSIERRKRVICIGKGLRDRQTCLDNQKLLVWGNWHTWGRWRYRREKTSGEWK